MDTYLVTPILDSIYSYMSWYTLKNINNIPERIWECVCMKFCTDLKFKELYDIYRSILDTRSFRKVFLILINHMMIMIKGEHDDNIPDILWKDKDFVCIASKYSDRILKHVPIEMRSDAEFVLNVILNYPDGTQYMDCSLRSNRDFARKFLLKYPDRLFCFGDTIKSDKELVCELLKLDSGCFCDVSENLRCDRDVALIAIRRPYNWKFIPNILRRNPEFMLRSIKLYPYSFQKADYSLTQNRDFLLSAAKLGCNVLCNFDMVDKNFIATLLLAETCLID